MLINSSDISGLTHSANGHKKVTFLQQKMRYILSQGTGGYTMLGKIPAPVVPGGIMIYFFLMGANLIFLTIHFNFSKLYYLFTYQVPMHLMRLAVPI